MLNASEVYITDLKCHLSRIEANLKLNQYALEASYLKNKQLLSTTDKMEMKTMSTTQTSLPSPGDGWSYTSTIKNSSSSTTTTPTAITTTTLPTTSSTSTTTTPSTTSVTTSNTEPNIPISSKPCIKVVELEWGSDVTDFIPFDIVIACEVLHWPALDLFQVTYTVAIHPLSLFYSLSHSPQLSYMCYPYSILEQSMIMIIFSSVYILSFFFCFSFFFKSQNKGGYYLSVD